MSFLRRNKKASDSADHAVQTPPATKPAQEKKSAGGGIRQWLIDSYNGIYKIVLEPSMPTKQTIILLVVGLIIGLLWAYALSPVIFTGANPNRLNQPAQDQWLLMVAASYERGFYGEDQARGLLNRIDNPTQAIARMLSDDTLSPSDRQALSALEPITVGVGGTPTPQSPGLFGELWSGWIIIILLVVILTPILVVVWRLLIYPNIAFPIVQRVRMMVNPAERERVQHQRQELRIQREQRKLADELSKEATVDVELGEPVMKRVSIYSKGRIYDDSFEIELPLDQGGDFLGQCGAVIAESVEPDPIAVEVWLFDMFSHQNIKRVFVTEAGAADPSVRARLAADVANPETDIIVAKPGATITLDSDKLRLSGKLMTVSAGADGRFENFQMQIQTWQKSKAGGGMAQPLMSPVGQSGMAAPMPMASPPPIPPAQPLPDYNDITFDPPPQPPMAPPPMSPPPPSIGSMMGGAPQAPQPLRPLSPPPGFDQPPARPQPLSPPPLQFPEDDEDDPFGNTGDFTPLGR